MQVINVFAQFMIFRNKNWFLLTLTSRITLVDTRITPVSITTSRVTWTTLCRSLAPPGLDSVEQGSWSVLPGKVMSQHEGFHLPTMSLPGIVTVHPEIWCFFSFQVSVDVKSLKYPPDIWIIE